MSKTARLLFPSLIALTVAAASAAAEEVRPLEFIHALQEKGYQDIAVEYLTALLDRQEKGQGAMPEEVADVFDLEMAKSMRGAAGRAYNAKDASQLIASAQEHLNKFLKEKPNHAEAENALVSFAGFIMDDALKNQRSVKAATDKAEKAKLSATARTGMEEARSKFRTAADKIMVRIKALPPLPAAPKAGRPGPQYVKALKVRQKLNYLYFTALFQAGLCDYYLAQTFADGSDPGRAASLKKAAEMFNFVYQYNRIDEVTGRVNPIGLQAHMWEGKSREEVGDWETAVDIYDECLANAPDANDRSPPNKAFEPLFAQVEEFRMGILLKQKPDQFFKEAPDWLEAYTARWKMYDGFQGVALMLAKEYLKDPSKAKEGRGILEAISRVPSSHQQEAIQLLHGPGGGKAIKLEDAKTFEEAVAAGDSALKEKKWPEAVKAFRAALKMAEDQKGKKGAPSAERLAKVHEVLAAVEYEIALQLFQAGKFAESLELCSRIIQEEKTAPVTPSAALLAVHSQMGIYTAVPATEKEKRRLPGRRWKRSPSSSSTHGPTSPRRTIPAWCWPKRRSIAGTPKEPSRSSARSIQSRSVMAYRWRSRANCCGSFTSKPRNRSLKWATSPTRPPRPRWTPCVNGPGKRCLLPLPSSWSRLPQASLPLRSVLPRNSCMRKSCWKRAVSRRR